MSGFTHEPHDGAKGRPGGNLQADLRESVIQGEAVTLHQAGQQIHRDEHGAPPREYAFNDEEAQRSFLARCFPFGDGLCIGTAEGEFILQSMRRHL